MFSVFFFLVNNGEVYGLKGQCNTFSIVSQICGNSAAVLV